MIAGINSIYMADVLSGNSFLAIATGAAVRRFTLREIIGTWIAAALTLCIFSFLYEDNPFYKFAEHLFVGVSAGYIIATTFQNVMIPNLFGNIATGYRLLAEGKGVSWGHWSFLLAGVLGIMMLMKLVPSVNWLSRWPLSFMVGIASGLGIVLTMEAFVLKQVNATIVELWVRSIDGSVMLDQTIRNWIIVLGVCCGLIYFYFSLEHKGLLLGTTSRIGIFVLMTAFGAAFGYTVMARVSLLIGRMLFFREEFWPVVRQTFGIG